MNDNGCSCDTTECGSSCSSANCGSRPQDFIEKTHEFNSIKRVVGVVSGKGGVGKSLVTSTLAVMMRRYGYKVGILDADITGPSIPKVFGVTKKAEGDAFGIYPQKSDTGISLMSVNLLLEKDDSPVIWRGPIIAGTVKKFWTDVIWGDIDYLFIDMPPGTGDVPLTVFQSIPLDGIVIVTSPQDLVSLIVKKAYNMAQAMNIPILGIVENMSYLKCPDCEREIKLFGDSKIDTISENLGIKVLGKMPIDPEVAELCDQGEIEKINTEYLKDAAQYIEKNLTLSQKESDIMKIAIATEGNSVSGHFGKCENFTIVEIENDSVKSKEIISTIGNQHGLLPAFLAAHQVKVVIAGGMGEGARQNLNSNSIEIISGVSGNIEEIINAYINGSLKSSNAGCSGHEHSHHHSEGGCNCSHS
ncbi:MAG: ATPase involved in chromosome partitioning [Clostridia bacterium]|nr:ATPase involved in chromosome partitioning [Clostridia bacterium]